MSTHQVQVLSLGREFAVADEQSVLMAALDVGITLPHGCKDGACGSCKGRVIAGRVRHDTHAATALSDAEEAAGYALFCCAHALSDLVIDVRVAASLDGIVARKMPARIERIERPAPDVAMLFLTLPAGEQLLFRAGQYVDFLLPGGERRSYSIASMPGSPGPLEFHIRHLPGGIFTDVLFGNRAPPIAERSIVRVEGPLGTFHLREDDRHPIVLLASGTGFAPIKAIAETIFAKGLNRDDPVTGRHGRPVVLYWGARTRADLYLDELPRRWAIEQANFRYVPVLSEAADVTPDAAAAVASKMVADSSHYWTGRTGLVHRAVMDDLPDLSAYQVFACGVPVMVEAAHRDFVGRCRLPEEQFFSDAFVSRADLAAAVASK